MPTDALAPRRHQILAPENLQAALGTPGWATVILPCGSAKSRFGTLLAERRAMRRTLVFVPSPASLVQSLSESRATWWPFRALAMCSVTSTADMVQARANLRGGDVDASFWVRPRPLVTTPAAAPATLPSGERQGRPLASLCSHHSAPALVEDARLAGVEFDLIIADEAHHLAGPTRPDFRLRLASRSPAGHRVFMTPAAVTTTTGASAISMSHQRLVGPLEHHLPLPAAGDRGLLAGHPIMVFEIEGRQAGSPMRRVGERSAGRMVDGRPGDDHPNHSPTANRSSAR